LCLEPHCWINRKSCPMVGGLCRRTITPGKKQSKLQKEVVLVNTSCLRRNTETSLKQLLLGRRLEKPPGHLRKLPGVLDTAQLARGVHGQQRNANIHGPDPEPGGRERADGGAAGH